MNYRDFIDQMQQDAEDEQRRRERLSRVNSSRSDRAKAKEDDKNVVERIGDVLGGIGNFGKELLIDPVVDSISTAGTGISHAYDDISGTTAEREKKFYKSQDEWQEMLLTQSKKKNDPNLSAEERKLAADAAASISKAMSEEQRNFQSATKVKIEDTDPLKQAGATVTLASTVMPAKIGSVSKIGTRGTGVATRAVTNPALRRAAGNVISDATLGATFSAADLARREGSDASVADYAGAAGMGAAFGGAVSGGSQLLSRGVRQEAGEAIGRGRDAVQQQIADFNALPRMAREGGYVRIPGSSAADDAAKATVPVTTRLDDTLSDVAQKDVGIASRAAPGEVDPVTGLRNNALPGGTDEGVVTMSRDQIMKNNKVQR